MSRSASKEIKTSIIHQKQKDGDFYVLERKRDFMKYLSVYIRSRDRINICTKKKY